MIRAIVRPLGVACLLPLLAGCALFNTDPVIPPESGAVGIAGQNSALQDKIRDGHGDEPDVFLPLAEAEAAVADARAQPGVDQYAAEILARAQTHIRQAQALWVGGDKETRDDVERLARIEALAHNARSLAGLARYTALGKITVAQLDNARAQLQRLRADRGPTGGLIGRTVVPGALGAFEFRSGTAQLVAQSQPVVAKLAALLKQNPNVGVAILGHTDNSEPPAQALQRLIQANPQLQQRDLPHEQLVQAYHIALSNARAGVVARALVQAGIAPERIGAQGFGSQRPVASNATAEGRAANERVQALIIPGPNTPGSPLANRDR